MIKNEEVVYPNYFSQTAKNFINKLLVKKIELRLFSGENVNFFWVKLLPVFVRFFFDSDTYGEDPAPCNNSNGSASLVIIIYIELFF